MLLNAQFEKALILPTALLELNQINSVVLKMVQANIPLLSCQNML